MQPHSQDWMLLPALYGFSGHCVQMATGLPLLGHGCTGAVYNTAVAGPSSQQGSPWTRLKPGSGLIAPELC